MSSPQLFPNYQGSKSCRCFCSSLCASRKRSPAGRLSIVARNSSSGNGSRLIIPGGGGSQQQQQSRLVLPGQDRDSKKALIDTSGVQGPSTTSFRPPPGFMDAETDLKNQAYGPLDPQEARNALDRIRSQAAYWHELAKLFPRLAAAGYDSQVVEAETGLERVIQNSWIAAQQVYDSLKASGQVPPEKLAFFDSEEGPNQLGYMRYLPVSARPATAIYIVDNNLDAVESAVLERAVKEQERREGHKEGFSTSPGDCMAYKYYRDAVETKNEDIKTRLLKKGLQVAVTDPAKKALTALLEGEEEDLGILAPKAAALSVVRLTGEEVEFRPIPMIGEMAETSSASVAAAVAVKQSGPFNAFTLTPESAGQEFVALPAFRSLLLARSPVALSLKNCAEEPLIIRSVNARTEEEKLRQKGPGLVVFDRQVPDEIVSEDFYVREKDGSSCEIVEGIKMSDLARVCGKVLFVCKPPARTAEARLDSYALYSV